MGKCNAEHGRRRGGLRLGARAVRLVFALFPATGLGLGVGVAAVAALRLLAYGQLDLVMLVAGYGALALLALSLLVVLPTSVLQAVRLRRMDRPAPYHGPEGHAPRWIEAGRPTPTGASLPAMRWLPLVRLRLHWAAPREAQARGKTRHGRLHEVVVFQTRGRFERIERRLVVEDAFGLARVTLWRAASVTWRVLPAVGALRHVPLLRSISGGEEWPHPMGVEAGDRLELRRYAPGDPARFIHWRAFARTRKLVVRVPERALSRAHRTVAYLVTGDADEASAAAARTVLESGTLGRDWTFGADGSGATDRLADALDAICDSPAHRDHGGKGLEPFLREAERKGPASLVLFCPARPGPWLDRVADVLARRVLPAHVVVGVDGLAQTHGARSAWRRWLLRPEPRPEVDRPALERVVRRLQQARATVSVVDRPTGRLARHGNERGPMRPASIHPQGEAA